MNNREHSIEKYCRASIQILQTINMVRHEDASNMISGMINNFSGLMSENANHEVCLRNIRMLMEFELDPGLTSTEKQLFNHALDNIEILLNNKRIENSKSDLFGESIQNLEINNAYLKSKTLSPDALKAARAKIEKDLIAEDKKTNPMHILEIQRSKPLVTKIKSTQNAPHSREIKAKTQTGSAELAKKIHEKIAVKAKGVSELGLLGRKHTQSPRSTEGPIPSSKRNRKT